MRTRACRLFALAGLSPDDRSRTCYPWGYSTILWRDPTLFAPRRTVSHISLELTCKVNDCRGRFAGRGHRRGGHRLGEDAQPQPFMLTDAGIVEVQRVKVQLLAVHRV